MREHVFDALTPEQVSQLESIAGAVLERLDPEGRVAVGIRAAARRRG